MLLSVVAAYLLLPPQYVLTLPFSQNLTALNTEIAPSWVPEPQGRGTWNLLYSCVFTLTLCVWTAIHLNIPPGGESWLQHWKRKLKWVIVGIFLPEMVVLEAWTQWRRARVLSKELNLLRDKGPIKRDLSQLDKSTEDEASTPYLPQTFSVTYAFYAIMGGFVVDVSHIHDTYTRMAIAPQGVLWLTMKGHCLKMSDESIRDKSKADVLAKGLVCFQVSWLLLQCIARKANGYPLTVLEIHTLVHVACALCIYSLWFQKPLDIKDPTVIDSTAFNSTLALMLMRSEGNDYCTYNAGDEKGNKVADLFRFGAPESAYVYKYDSALNPNSVPVTDVPPSQNEAAVAEVLLQPVPLEEHKSPEVSANSASSNSVSSNKVEKFSRSMGTLDVRKKYCRVPDATDVVDKCLRNPDAPDVAVDLQSGEYLRGGLGPIFVWGGSVPGPFHMQLAPKAVLRWNLAAEELGDDGEIYVPDHIRLLRKYPSVFLRPNNRNTLEGTVWNQKVDDDDPDGIVSCLLAVCYGAIHAVAWNFEFPTTVEKTMWRVACVSCIAGFLGFAFIMSIAQEINTNLYTGRMTFLEAAGKEVGREFEGCFKYTRKSWRSVGGILNNILEPVFDAFGFLNLFLMPYFVAARLYIVVESFISLRRVPIGVYVSIPWTEYIPHL